MRITGGSWFAVAVGRSSRDVELHGRALGDLIGWMDDKPKRWWECDCDVGFWKL